jgi:hypothetical protein
MSLVGLLVAVALVPMPCSAVAQKADPPAAKAKEKEYELRIIRVGNTFQGIRFKVGTGETWLMNGDKYDKLPESGALPAGDYDVMLVTDDTNFIAFRIDRQSGATWQLRERKWVKMKEPE